MFRFKAVRTALFASSLKTGHRLAFIQTLLHLPVCASVCAPHCSVLYDTARQDTTHHYHHHKQSVTTISPVPSHALSTMDASQVFATTPDAAPFQGMLSPASMREPQFLPPPAPGSVTPAPPVLIPDNIYKAALDPKVPITIAAVYAVTAKLLNWYNTSNNKKPWAISKTRLFHVFIVVHNIFLAVYSAWTFYGMVGVMRRSVVNPWGPEGLNGFVDSMTRLHGPAGLGNAVYYNQEDAQWKSYSNSVALASDGTPSRTDLGRIWNEGLAFYGWIFYLSKFYEVLDTLIILAKGKQSSVLQTYHHAGAMMCMWAGMRYMSPPIWMFVFVNSGIHAMMVS